MFQWTELKQKTWWERFSDQPHQLFFISTIFWAICIMTLSMVAMISPTLDINFTLIHGFGITYGVFANAFLGFLLTVIPRYTKSIPIERREYITIWGLFEIGLFSAFVLNTFAGMLFVAIALLLCGVVFVKTILKAVDKKQPESLWLTILIFVASFVLFSHLLFETELTLNSLWFFVFPLVFVVTSRMIPAFFSSYFGQAFVEKPLWVLPLLVPLFWLVALFQTNTIILFGISIFLCVGLVLFLSKLDIYKKSPPILWILAVGLSWLPIGIFALGIESFFEVYTLKLSLHILTLGFVFTLLIGFGTRVILGHSNQKVGTDKYTLSLFLITQVIVLMRILGSIFYIVENKVWIGLVHLSFTLWILLFIAWAVKFADTLLRIKK